MSKPIDDDSVDEEMKAFYSSAAYVYHERFVTLLFIGFLLGMAMIISAPK